MKNAMFQFYIAGEMIHDTGLIEIDDAMNLFHSSREEFKSALESDKDPEMAVWINCRDDNDYRECLLSWDCTNVMVHSGKLWQLA